MGARKLREIHENGSKSLKTARRRQETQEFKQAYNRRAGIEGTLSQGIRVCDLRHARYRGKAKVHVQQVFTATALNFNRISAWFSAQPCAQTRRAPFLQRTKSGA